MIESAVIKQIYLGDGITTNFPFAFPFNEAEHVKVAIHDIATETERTITRDYYVDAAASKVVYPGYPPGEEPPESERPGPLPTGKKLVIYRETPINQMEDLGEKYPLTIVEEMADKATMILQEMGEKLERAVLVERGGETTPQDIVYDISHLKEYKDAAAGSASAAAQSAQAAAGSATTAGNYKASVEQTVNTFNTTVQSAVDRAVVSATSRANGFANQAAASAQSAAAYLASTQSVAAAYSQEGQAILAGAAQYARQAAQDAAGIHEAAIPAWNSRTVYSYPDVVAYTDGNNYRCIGENVPAGTLPTTSNEWVRITYVNGDDYFEIDLSGGLQPRVNPTYSASWDLDGNGNIMPKGLDDEITIAAETAAQAAALEAIAARNAASESKDAAAASEAAAKAAEDHIDEIVTAATLLELDADDNITVKDEESEDD